MIYAVYIREVRSLRFATEAKSVEEAVRIALHSGVDKHFSESKKKPTRQFMVLEGDVRKSDNDDDYIWTEVNDIKNSNGGLAL